MPWSATLPDVNNPTSNFTYTDANLEGLAYDEAYGFRDMIGSMLLALGLTNVATSITSHNFTVSSKVFAIVGGYGFRAGSAVRCADVAGTSYMDGLVTACTPNSSVTVNVLAVGAGSGANASWVITLGTSASTIVSTPVSLANGGTAGTTAALARTNLEVGRLFRVSSILSTPPGSPADQQKHLVGLSPTGAYVGHGQEIATYTTGVGWGFTVPAAGDGAYDVGANELYLCTATAQYSDGIYPGSVWKRLSQPFPRWASAGSSNVDANYSVVAADNGKFFTVGLPVAPVTITLPVSSNDVSGMVVMFEVSGDSANGVTFVISGGSNLRLTNNTQAASLVVAGSTYKRYRFIAVPAGSSHKNSWYVEEP